MDIVNELRTSASTECDLSKYIELAVHKLSQSEGQSKVLLHSHLCRVLSELKKENLFTDGPQTAVLHALGPSKALEAIGVNLPKSSLFGARWLEYEVVKMMKSGTIEDIVWQECTVLAESANIVTMRQDVLLRTISKLPDLVSSKLGKNMERCLFPVVYYESIASIIFNTLKNAVMSLKGSKDVSVGFIASLIAKCSLIGHKESFWGCLCPKLEKEAQDCHIWRRVCRLIMKRVPEQSLESVIDGMLRFTSISLLESPLYYIFGDLPLELSHAKYILTQKYVTVRPTSQPRALIGYFNSSESLQGMIPDILSSALSLWADLSVLRHMTVHRHLNLTGIIVLATTCLESVEEKIKSSLQKIAMKGIQVHLENPQEIIRIRGMVVGEHLMKSFYLSTGENLKFTYDDNLEDVVWLKSLMKPLSNQESILLLEKQQTRLTGSDQSPKIEKQKANKDNNEISSEYGKGLVHVNHCSDDDSDDDDLQPYDMSNDLDTSHSKSPRYLRHCLEDLLSKEFEKRDVAVRSIKSLIEKSPLSVLTELCIELVKLLLHVDISEETSDMRVEAIITVTCKCPAQVAVYLCDQFYSPHYNLKQRMEILEILSKTAISLSLPTKTEVKFEELSPRQFKPWQLVVEERIKAKTKIISKGPSKPPLQPVENRFSSVCCHFFFPLMLKYDKRLDTVDLLGRDSFVLGQVLHTLGTVLQCAHNSPSCLSMAIALQDFCWTFKHHSAMPVRRGVLYCLCSIVSSSPVFIVELLERGLNEMLIWAKEIVSNDASAECRQLAGLALSIFQQSIDEKA